MDKETIGSLFPNKEAEERFMPLVLILNLAVRIHVDIFANFEGDLEVSLLLHAVVAACQATDPRDRYMPFWACLQFVDKKMYLHLHQTTT